MTRSPKLGLLELSGLTSKKKHTTRVFKQQRAARKSKDMENYKMMMSKIQRGERQAYRQHVEEVIDPGDPDIADRTGKQKRLILSP